MKVCHGQRKGHGHGLSSMLSDSWSAQHRLQPFSECEQLLVPDSFVESECYKLGFCHCDREGDAQKSGMQSVFFHKKLVALLRPYLFTKKKHKKKDTATCALPVAQSTKKEHTKARKAMMKGFLIAEFVPMDADKPPCEESNVLLDEQEVLQIQQDTLPFNQWLALASQKVSTTTVPHVAQKPLPGKSVWLHVGYVNYKTMSISGLPLLCDSLQNHGQDDADAMQALLRVAEPLQPLSTLDFFKENISFGFKYQARFWAVQATDSILTANKMTAGQLSAKPFPGIPPLIVWQGQVLESWERDEESKRQKEKQKKQNANRKRKQPKRQTNRALVFPEPKAKRLRAVRPGEGAVADSAPVDLIEDDLDEPDLDEADHDEPGSEIGFDPGNDDQSPSPSYATSSCSSGGRNDMDLFMDFATETAIDDGGVEEQGEEEEMETDPCIEPEPEKETEKPCEATSSGSAKPSSGSELAPLGNTRETAEVLAIPGYGELRFHRTTNNIVAFCSAHRDEDCRRSRTVLPNSRRHGQGRPIGLLVSWLMDPESHKTPNAKRFVHPLAARQDARRWFDSLPRSVDFAKNERAVKAGESPEPEKIL